MKKIAFLAFLLAFCVAAGRAQESRQDVSLSGTALIEPFTASSTTVEVNSTTAFGALVSYRFMLTPSNALEANYGNTLFSQIYSSGNFTQARVQEATLAYQFTFGVAREARFHPFVEAGTGALFFSPVTAGSSTGVVSQNRAALLYGAGVAYRLTTRFSVQAGYRGLVYTAPDFALPTQVTNARTNMAEPYVGVSFRF